MGFFCSDGGTCQELHLQRLLSGITSWLDLPEAVVGAIKSGSTSERWGFMLLLLAQGLYLPGWPPSRCF